MTLTSYDRSELAVADPIADRHGHGYRYSLRIFVLPNSDRQPTRSPQPLIGVTIPRSVPLDFRRPIFGVGRGSTGPVVWTSVPKAPVDENSNSVLVKHKIWVPE